MPWNPTVSGALHEAFDAGNAEDFLQLLHDHPEYLRDEDGSDVWMWQAAQDGRLPIVRGLVELGLDINESRDHGDPENPFYTAEGAILHAAGSGHLEVVLWMLEHGAKINYVVQGKPRCMPLIRAAGNGHTDVVKLLIEHGADFHATWRRINAVTQAEDMGQFAIRDYLRSLGARTLRETTPPDYPCAHKRFLKVQTEQRGPLADWRREIPGDPLVTLQLIPANEKYDVHTLFTVGLSDHRLPQGPMAHACTELRCMLPADWPFTDAALADPNHGWPIDWLTRIVQELRAAERWPGDPAIFMNGDPPAPLAPDTQLCGWLCLASQGESVWAVDYRWIDIHSLFPIHAEEAALVRRSGHEELVQRFHAQDAPLYIDPHRPNMAVDPR